MERNGFVDFAQPLLLAFTLSWVFHTKKSGPLRANSYATMPICD